MTLEVTETGDYTTGALPETVAFGLQQATATVTIQTQDDTTAEDVGKLTVTLVDGTDYRAGWPNSHTFTIYDNDGAKPSVSVTKDQAWVDEGQPVSFTVTRTTPTDNALQARLELNRVRYRVTQADLDDPTRGITTPEHHPLRHGGDHRGFPCRDPDRDRHPADHRRQPELRQQHLPRHGPQRRGRRLRRPVQRIGQDGSRTTTYPR